MALNSTVKSASAESYGSVADADTYLQARGGQTWIDNSTENKEQYLRRATDFLERYYSERWKGDKTTLAQALAWPRVGIYEEGYLLSSDLIPNKVQRACFEAAYLISQGVDVEPDTVDSSSLILHETNIGSIEVTKEWAGYASDPQQFTKVHGLLKEFVKSKLHKTLLRI